ncbi:cofilin [Clydaea vesicula]|uniref:Cofilin n=1 Tax=Clydaea vesicula TaxID=447962 RepID=A0AAD5XTY6_9FUNG|nr:cofilin [Clydaea vesicula]
MSSGVGVNDQAVSVFQDLKLKKKYKYVIYKIADNSTEIVVENTVEEASYDDFVKSLPENECRYGVYDFQYEVPNEGQRNKILFYTWSPDTGKIKQKMLYAASKDALRKKLDGIYTEVQCTDLSELSYEAVFEKVTRMTRYPFDAKKCDNDSCVFESKEVGGLQRDSGDGQCCVSDPVIHRNHCILS